VNVKISEIEKLIGATGIRIINLLLATVSTASVIHRRSGGAVSIERIDITSVHKPAAITHRR
jgi:hypothetical protein